MATLISFSQLQKYWKIATGGAITLVGVGGLVITMMTQDSSGDVVMTERSDGSRAQSGELLVKDGALGVAIRPNGDAAVGGVLAAGALFANTMSGAGLTDCDADAQAMGWDATTRQFVCGDDDTGGGGSAPEVGTASFSGAIFRLAGPQYVNIGGDTMTGTLLVANNKSLQVQGTISGTTLKVLGTGSGNVLHGEKTLSSSGTVVWEGAASGSTLYIATSLTGVGLTDCDTAGTSKLLWDATTGRFACGTDADTDTNTTYTAGQGLSLNGTSFSLGSSISGSLLEFQTVSGSTVYGSKSLRSSGSLVWEGAASGATLYLGGKLEGAGLTDCDLSTQTLAWDATTGRFSCGTDSDTTYTAGQGLTLALGSFSVNGTLSGSLAKFQTLSGSTVKATAMLASSGALTWEGQGSGALLYIGGKLEGAGLTDCDTAGTSKLLWDITTGRFSCGTDQTGVGGSAPEVGTTSFSGGVLIVGNDRWVNDNGDTMTGALIIDVLNGNRSTRGLNIINTASGAVFAAQKTLASSGTLVVEGAVTFDTDLTVANGGTGFSTCVDGGFVFGDAANPLSCAAVLADDNVYIGDGTTEPGATALPSCSGANDTLNYDAALNTFSCGSDANTTYTAGEGLVLTSTSFSLADTISGTLLEFQTVSGSTVNATKTVASSGSIIAEGTLSGSALFVGGGASGQILTHLGTSTDWKTPTGGYMWVEKGALRVSTATNGPAPGTLGYGCTATDIRLDVLVAPTGSSIIVDVKRNGTSMLSVLPRIAANNKFSTGGLIFSQTTITGGSILTAHVTQVGSTTTGTGMTISLRCNRKL